MSQETNQVKKRPETDANSVIAFLLNQPDFFASHPDALQGLTLPNRHLGDGIVDFQTALIENLRQEITKLEGEREQLLATARANQQSLSRIQECILTLLSAKSFEQLIQSVTTDFAAMLNLDMVMLCIESDDEGPRLLKTPGLVILPSGTVGRYFEGDQRMLLRSDVDGDPEVFGGGAPLIRSDALVRLDIAETSPPALIAFGSRDVDRFNNSQSTELVRFLTQILEHVVRAWLDLPH